ncbi:unnamed protein product [Lepidochelys kempii]
MDVQQYCENCLACAQANPTPSKRNAPLKSQVYKGPWMALQIDFVGPLPRTQRGNQYLLVIVDPFSKWVEAFPLKAKTAKATAKVLLEQVFSQWGIPAEMESDQGSHFTGQFFRDCLKLVGVLQRLHIPYRPQSSGMVE